jgi:protoporphyrinogen oxidase
MIVILGGGLAGLAAAYELCKKGAEVIIIEKENSVGGLAASFKKNREFLPLCYHHIMNSDKITLGLIKKLGLSGKLYVTKARMVFNVNGKFYSLSTPMDLLKFKPLSFPEKIRFGLFILKVLSVKRLDKYNDISAKDFAIRYAGISVYKKIFEPLLKTKFLQDYDRIAARWLIYRLSIKESSGRFHYLDGGLNLLISGLEKGIKRMEGKIITNADVKKISIKQGKVVKILYSKGNKRAELFPKQVINTLPIPVFLAVAKGLPKEYSRGLRRVRYKSSLSVIIALNKKITNDYWINFLHNNYAFGGIFDHNTLNKKANNGNSLLYLFSYLNDTDKLWNLGEKNILKIYTAELEGIFPKATNHIKWAKIFKLHYSKPVYTKGYPAFKPEIKTPVSNLYMAGILLFPDMRTMGAAIKSGFDVARIIK